MVTPPLIWKTELSLFSVCLQEFQISSWGWHRRYFQWFKDSSFVRQTRYLSHPLLLEQGKNTDLIFGRAYYWVYGVHFFKIICIVVLEKTFESPLDSKKSKPVNPKENWPWIFIERTDAEAEAPILGPLCWVNLLEKTLVLGKIEGRRRRGQQRMRWLDGSLTQWIWVWVSSGNWWWLGRPGVLQSMGSQRVGHNWATEQQ